MDGGSLRGEGFDRRTDSTGNYSMVEDGLAPLLMKFQSFHSYFT